MYESKVLERIKDVRQYTRSVASVRRYDLLAQKTRDVLMHTTNISVYFQAVSEFWPLLGVYRGVKLEELD